MKNFIVKFIASIGLLFSFSQTGSADWVQTSGPYGGQVYRFAVNGGYLFAATRGHGIYRTTDNGENWTAVNSGLPESTFVTALVTNGGIVFAGILGKGLRFTVDSENNWTALDTESTILNFAFISRVDFFVGGINSIYRIQIASSHIVKIGLPSGGFVLDIAMKGGYLFAAMSGQGIYRTSDNGENWTAANTGLPMPCSISALEVNGGYLFAAMSGQGIYRTSDNGENWTAVNTGLSENAHVSKLLAKGGILFAKIDSTGIYWTADDGTNWTEVKTSLPKNEAISDFAVSDGSLFLSEKHGNSIWRRPLSDLDIAIQPDEITDVNAKDTSGFTFLMKASWIGNDRMVKELLNLKADVNAKANNGLTALMCASEEGHEAVVKLLLNAQADINAKDGDGHTALMWATEKGHQSVERLLREAGATGN